MRCIVPALLAVSALVTLSHAARILAVFAMGSHSHFILGFRLAKELADRGHQVTFVNAFPQKKPIKNLREISVAEIREGLDKKRKELYDMGQMTYTGQLAYVSAFGYSFTESVLRAKGVQKLLKSDEKFDLVLIENFLNEAMAIFQYKFKCPSVILTPSPPTIFNNHLFANPSQPAYVPNILAANFGTHTTLWERILNVYYDVVGELYVQLVNIPNQNALLQKYVPGAPYIRDILYNASFMLLTSHISLRDAAPLQPNMKDIGGYHLLPPKPLPKDLQEFLDNAKEGVIVFSMGSFLRSADFSREKKEAVLKVFSRLKQKVLWKYETDLPEKSDNVKIVSWMPQQDVLAHPNIVAFVTHVGLLGKIEAVYYGVPMLGLPVYWDQEKNGYDAARQGFALTIPFPQLTEKNFAWALNELINNSKYRDNAKTRSKIMHDQPLKQLDEAMFWIEYVIRHKGAPHFRTPALNLKWYQRLLLDVILVVGVTVVSICVIISYLLKWMLNSINKNYLKRKEQKLD
ncbi:UDP-glucuronosyltransferase 2B9-like [Anoplophora glabripennis]|uniref:UDP-glucuronosyltransferase 2B9-like n=1 Tax=Anoplophora glabripennis TaxID=217634 RepID=UPI00087539E7|nr:UDP-glucuronosyltransferase 2B9-like [Anoplophora glabripennis]